MSTCGDCSSSEEVAGKFDRCWGCGQQEKNGELAWVEGFGYGTRCNCSKNGKFREMSSKLNMRQILRRVGRLYG